MISRFEVENYKRVKLIQCDMARGVNEITGGNGAGKSSYIDAAQALLGGKEALAYKPIRDGAEEARISAVITGVGPIDLHVVRRIKKNDSGATVSSLTIEGEGGARFASPQTLLDGLITDFTFDPLKFIGMAPKDQIVSLQEFVNADLDAMDAENKADFEKRTIVNRRAKELRAQAAGIVVPTEVTAARIDETALVDEMQRAGEHNAEIERQKALIQARMRDRELNLNAATKKSFDAKSLRAQADELDRLAVIDMATAQEITDDINSMPSPAHTIDASAVKAKIEQARLANSAFDKMERRRGIIADAEIAEAEAADLTSALATRDADKKAAIAASKMPIEGLSFEDGRVIYNGQPIEQASQAEQIRVSVAIAAARSPKLKVAFIKDGSLLDKKSWALLEKFAVEHDLQVFVETVDSSRPSAILIEDGMVVGAAKHMEAAE